VNDRSVNSGVSSGQEKDRFEQTTEDIAGELSCIDDGEREIRVSPHEFRVCAGSTG
jgi:hypothetical protein